MLQLGGEGAPGKSRARTASVGSPGASGVSSTANTSCAATVVMGVKGRALSLPSFIIGTLRDTAPTCMRRERETRGEEEGRIRCLLDTPVN